MTTMTAQLIVGHAHPNDGGINPTHWLYLSENSRPAWILCEENLLGACESEPIEWIPSGDHLLEDALLMIAVCVCREEKIIEAIQKNSPSYKVNGPLHLNEIEEEQRLELYHLCREKKYRYKIVASVFAGSSLTGCEKLLEEYEIEHEVCLSRVKVE